MITRIDVKQISILILSDLSSGGQAEAIRTTAPAYPFDDGRVEQSASGAIPLGPVTPDDVEATS